TIVEPQAAEKGVELTIATPEPSVRVLADRHRVQQILINLVGNAIKFTPRGGTIHVTATHDESHAVIQATDTGIGIPHDRLEVVFEPFVQVDTSLTRTVPGTGLGLAISRDLARAMHGELAAASELGKGSTFTLTLALVRS